VDRHREDSGAENLPEKEQDMKYVGTIIGTLWLLPLTLIVWA
jgi:hypothetical protein